MSRVMKLVEERDRLLEKQIQTDERLAEINSELASELGLSGAAPVESARTKFKPAPAKRATRKRQADANGDEEEEGRKQPTLKSLILEYLATHENAKLKDFVTHIALMVKNGEWKTKAKDGKVAPIISQSLIQLKSEGVVESEKDPKDNRLIYSLPASA